MFDFNPVVSGEKTIADLADGLGKDDLVNITKEMLDNIEGMIAGCVDADVVFVPVDADAYDEYAASPEEEDLSWTLGHVIVHTTASAEEAAFLAAELARGVNRRGGRARVEVPWQTVKTMDQVRQRLAESRRMRLASLDMWPEPPHLDNSYMRKRGLYINGVSQYLLGLQHESNHLGQIEDIVAQAKAARAAKPALQGS